MSSFIRHAVLSALLLTTTIARSADKPGIWIHVLDDGTSFEAHPAATAALELRSIAVETSTRALTDRLVARARGGGAIVIVDGARFFADFSDAAAAAEKLVEAHGANATYVYLTEPMNLMPAVKDVGDLRGRGPVNATAMVDQAVRRRFPPDKRPERITVLSQDRAQVLLANPAFGTAPLPQSLLPEPLGEQRLVVLGFGKATRTLTGIFERGPDRPTAAAIALMTAMNEPKLKSISYEILGGESTVAARRFLAFATEAYAGVSRPIEIHLRLHTRGDDPRAGTSLLRQSQERWLPVLEESSLGERGRRPQIRVSVEKLYASERTLGPQREIEVRYRPRLASADASVPLKIRFENDRVIVESAKALRAVTVTAHRAGENPVALREGTTVIPADAGPTVEIAIESNGTTSDGKPLRYVFPLVEESYRKGIAEALFGTGTAIDLSADLATTVKNVRDGGTFIGSGPGAATPLARPLPAVPARTVFDESLYDAIRAHFPDMAERIRTAGAPPFELMGDDEKIMERIERALLKTGSGNVAILGEPGTGKTELVRTFIYRVRRGDVPTIPRNTKFFEVNKSNLVADTMYRGQLEAKLKPIFNAADLGAPVYLVCDEFHSLVGAGATKDSPADALQDLKAYIADGRIHVIAMDTVVEFEIVQRDPALVRRFGNPCIVEERTRAQVVTAMQGWIRNRGFAPLDTALLEYVYALSEKYGAAGGQPSRATNFLDEYYAYLRQKGVPSGSRETIDALALEFYRLEAADLDDRARETRLLHLREEMDAHVIGQKPAKELLYNFVLDELLNIGPHRKISDTSAGKSGKGVQTVLLAGPPGVGKSELARIYGRARSGNRFFEFSLSGPLQEDPAALFREIGRKLSKNAHAVLFLDEFEKASPAVQTAFLNALGDGYVDYTLDGRVNRVSLRHVTIIVATNAGQEYVRSHQGVFDPVEHERMEARGLGEAYRATHQGVFVRTDLEVALTEPDRYGRALTDTIVRRFAGRTVPMFPPTEAEFRAMVQARLAVQVADLSGRDFVGPIEVANVNEYVDSVVRAKWSPLRGGSVTLEEVEEAVRQALRPVLLAQRASRGERPCDPLMIRLSTM